MSELREAAQAALTAYETFRDVDDIDGLDDAMDRLRAALAQPEVPCYAGNARKHVICVCPDCVATNYREWRPASEPPDTPPHDYLLKKLAMVMPLFEEARDALTAISEQQRAARCISPTLADRMDMAGTYSIDDWRDVTPPTEGAK